MRTFFGDIQQHSAHSDGTGCADESYLRARDVYGDDFVALTDHESFLGKRTAPGEWAYLQAVADRYNSEMFATLIAYEWTGAMHPGPGHKCVYFPTSPAPLISRDEIGDGKRAVEKIASLGGFSSPHHIGWTGANFEAHSEVGQPLWEICSCHGCYEHANHPLGGRGDLQEHTAIDALKRGFRFGFSASSDAHGLLWHHGECRQRDPYRTGLTAVQAPTLSRASIFEALKNRRCYATSGAKIYLDVRTNDEPMGTFLDAACSDFRVDIDVAGSDGIAAIEIVTDSGFEKQTIPEGQHQIELKARVRSSGGWIYVRITQQDGHMAWSSPVFCPKPSA